MDFKDQLKQFTERVSKLKSTIATEEATKNAFIMPFIQMLGYDVFDPTEVVPEMDCDIAKKKGEKIDYGIMKDGEAIMLVECKHWQQNLSLHETQLQRYFPASKARFGLLTNGVIFRFYTDLEKSNIMDTKPFLEIDIENIRESQVEELKKFHKSYFNVENILSSASELKYMAELKAVIRDEFASPSAELVKILAKRVYSGVMLPKVLEQFTELVRRSLSSHVNDVLSERLNVAMKTTEDTPPQAPEAQDAEEEKPKIVTTESETQAYYIVKSILREIVPAEKITFRDAQSYSVILFEDNNRKPILRLYFNNEENKRIAFIDAERKETRYNIESLDDIFNYQDELIDAVTAYI